MSGRDGPEFGSRTQVIRREDINVRAIADEAVAASAPTVRLEACVEQPPGTLQGDAEHRPNIHERVDVAGGEADPGTMLGFKDGDHLTTDEDPRQGVEDRGDLAGQAPQRGIGVAGRSDPDLDRIGHPVKRPRSSVPTWRLRGSSSSIRSRATAALGAT